MSDEYVLKHHLYGLIDALGLPADTHISVFAHPHTGWTDEQFDTLAGELGSSVKTIKDVRSQVVYFDERAGVNAEVCVFGPR